MAESGLIAVSYWMLSGSFSVSPAYLSVLEADPSAFISTDSNPSSSSDAAANKIEPLSSSNAAMLLMSTGTSVEQCCNVAAKQVAQV